MKIEGQKIGDFIVNAIDAIHFKVVSSEQELTADSGFFFAPKFVYWMLGEEERILGYEGLQIIIYLSSQRLIPCVEVSFTAKAPSSVKIDDIV